MLDHASAVNRWKATAQEIQRAYGLVAFADVAVCFAQPSLSNGVGTFQNMSQVCTMLQVVQRCKCW